MKKRKPRLKLLRGTRAVSFLFIAVSLTIAASVMFAANMYYDLDSNQVVTEETFTVGSGGTTYFSVDNSNGDTTVEGNLTVKGNTTIGDASGDTVTSNADAWTFANATTVTLADAVDALNFDSNTLSIDASNNRIGIGTNSPNETLTLSGALSLAEQSSAPSATTGFGKIFVPDSSLDSDLNIHYITSGGTEREVCDSSGNCQGAGGGYVGGSGAASQVAFWTDNSTISGSNNLYWDFTNNRLGIGTTAPSYALDVNGDYVNSSTGFCIGGSCITSWSEAGQGTITAVGNITSGNAFTSGSPGQYLYFEGSSANGSTTKLIAADASANQTITLPDATGTVALGTGTSGYVAYWSGTNAISGEQYLSVSRGGLGGDVTPTGAGEILYSTGTTAYDSLAAGTSGQLLVSGGAGAPSWSNIADIITAQNGLTESGTTDLTIELGGTLSENTTITQGDYNMIFNLTGTGDFKVQDNGTDILTVSDDGKVYFKTYPLAESGKQVLRGMVPIMGFDLPAQCSTCASGCGDPSSTPLVSRVIENYPFPSAEQGSTRIHKLVVRYATSDQSLSPAFYLKVCKYDSGTSSWVEADSVNLNSTESTSLNQGEATVTTGTTTNGTVEIPTDGTDWYLTVVPNTGADTIRVYQIFLAAYDEID